MFICMGSPNPRLYIGHPHSGAFCVHLYSNLPSYPFLDPRRGTTSIQTPIGQQAGPLRGAGVRQHVHISQRLSLVIVETELKNRRGPIFKP
jgi:hypothetical protein